MSHFRQHIIKIHMYLLFRQSRGAIAVEYALCMALAALFMFGVFSMFEDMSVKIINEFKRYVISFPNT